MIFYFFQGLSKWSLGCFLIVHFRDQYNSIKKCYHYDSICAELQPDMGNAVFNGKYYQSGSIAAAFNCTLTYEKLVGNFSIGKFFTKQNQYFSFPCGEFCGYVFEVLISPDLNCLAFRIACNAV